MINRKLKLYKCRMLGEKNTLKMVPYDLTANLMSYGILERKSSMRTIYLPKIIHQLEFTHKTLSIKFTQNIWLTVEVPLHKFPCNMKFCL